MFVQLLKHGFIHHYINKEDRPYFAFVFNIHWIRETDLGREFYLKNARKPCREERSQFFGLKLLVWRFLSCLAAKLAE
jgi:hypothetical protein